VVAVADEGFFGLDGTQPLPPDPLLPDPLGGLVTGFTFADLEGEVGAVQPPFVPVVIAPAQVRRRPAAGPKRPATRPPAAAAAPPAAIPVAASLPIRQRQPRQTSAARPTAIPVARPGYPARPDRAVRQTPKRRSGGGAGCSIFLLIVVILVFGFVVLGIVLGHGNGGFGTGGGG
jgi:hypothetical protein